MSRAVDGAAVGAVLHVPGALVVLAAGVVVRSGAIEV